jgi:hypothetical protein
MMLARPEFCNSLYYKELTVFFHHTLWITTKEKSQILMGDDCILGKKEKCSLELSGDKIVAKNSKNTLELNDMISLVTSGNEAVEKVFRKGLRRYI